MKDCMLELGGDRSERKPKPKFSNTHSTHDPHFRRSDFPLDVRDTPDDALGSYAYSTTIDTGTRSIHALQASSNLKKGCSGKISRGRGGRREG